MMRKSLVSLMFLCVLWSCKRKEEASWETDVLVPLFKSTMGIEDLSAYGSDTGADGLVSLVYSEKLADITLKDFFEVPDTEIVANLTLDSLRLADNLMQQDITLQQIYPAASALNGQNVPVPPLTTSNAAPTDIDASSLFTTATFLQGFMDISLTNNFPIDLERLEFKLTNKSDGSIIIQDVFTNVASGATATKSIDLTGKTVEAALQLQIVELKTYASNGSVLINKNDYCRVVIQVRNMRVSKATAVFPDQSVYKKDENAEYYFNGAQLKKLKIKSGKLKLTIVSTIEEDMTVDYTIPHARKGSLNVNETMKVPASAPGTSTRVEREIDLAGYILDLRGRVPDVDNEYNKFYNILDVRIDSSGKLRTITLQDSIYVYYGLLDLVPEWCEGYFGQQQMASDVQLVDFAAFNGGSGTLELQDVKLNLRIENGFGMSAGLSVNEIKGINQSKGSSVVLNTSNVISNPASINAATDAPFTVFKASYDFTTGNSNIKPFIENLPNKLQYNIDLITNPNGNVNNFKDFAYSNSNLTATLEATIPLHLKADSLSLASDVDVEIFAQENAERIKEGSINLRCKNGFPAELQIHVYMLDQNGNPLDRLTVEGMETLPAAPIDNVTGKVISPVEGRIKLKMNRSQTERLKSYPKIRVVAVFNTIKNNTQPVKFYNSYKLDVLASGNFIYEQSFK